MSEKNLYENEDPSWTMHMQTLMKRKKNMEIAQTIDEAIREYYSLHGLPVPDWKQKRDPDWWTKYLTDLGLDPKNP
ncbi:hypothetical protein Np200711_191 [Cyanophage S-RIM44]|uniref:Uncharacterized protein n=1 Tax=Cyanophage S-RIM44 TaxID=1278485 RepID=A0A1D7SDE9_9CAUD|nr:hypothetical protein HOQ83_gp076 [Cyanophage S-RIM44]AOO11671.1 hypothetical protein ES420910_190 [Cyanophage S-RIM44]AOO12137.1 hypothetical protein Np200711_191 [Cyanophage S-RIM44]AOO12372.1 hypothetical protein Np420711_190 [Cyanophage S-RIM44]AOO12837.1 hypothetical protein Sn130910_190 [Cyanophage S-RIM44]